MEPVSQGRLLTSMYPSERGNRSVELAASLRGSDRVRIGRRYAPVLHVANRRQPDHPSDLLFHQARISQFGDSPAGKGAINGLLGQRHILIALLFVATNQQKQQLIADFLLRHTAMVGTCIGARNGSSVPVAVTCVHSAAVQRSGWQ